MRSRNKSGMTLCELGEAMAGAACDLWFRELAFYSAVNFLSAALGKCEFRTYAGGKEVYEREYYLWNMQPNRNQNREEWLRELVAKLYRHGEVLVIAYGDDLLIADSGFGRDKYALYEDVFRGVTARGMNFNRTFLQSEVLYLRLNSDNMRAVVDAVNTSYSKLLAYSMTAYQRSRGTKGIYKYDSIPVKGTPAYDDYQAFINVDIKKWLSGDNAALALGNGEDWKELEHKTYTNESTRDIRAQIDDISDFTAKGAGIPPALLRGDVQGTKDALPLGIMTGLEPLARLIETEINRKRNGYTGFARGDRVQVYTGNIEHHDLLSSATSVDKLISSGFSVNEVRRLCGEVQIDAPWANEHRITKNYAPADNPAGGGTA